MYRPTLSRHTLTRLTFVLAQSASAAAPRTLSLAGHGTATLARPPITGARLPRIVMTQAAHAWSPLPLLPRLESGRLTSWRMRVVPHAAHLVPDAHGGVDRQEPVLGAATSPTTSTASLSLNVPAAVYGQPLKVTGTGFGASERVALSWDSPVARASAGVTASASGGFITGLRVPLLIAGQHTLYATGQRSGAIASAPFTIASSAYLSKASSPTGGQVTLVGVGFGSRETVAAYWAKGGRLRVGLLLQRGQCGGRGS